MATKRFDIAAASHFQSRDGGITKGGLVRNGFTDVDGAKERWANMRPALATSDVGALTGSGLGLFQVGGVLYGVSGTGAGGTATSWQVVLGTNFSLVAGSGGSSLWGFVIGAEGGPLGTMIRNKIGTASISELVTLDENDTNLYVYGTWSASGLFTRMILSTKTYLAASVTLSTLTGLAGAQTRFRWTSPATPLLAVATYTGGFA